MSTENFNEKLKVTFTMNELYEIASALNEEFFYQNKEGNTEKAVTLWELRNKVKKYIQFYNETL